MNKYTKIILAGGTVISCYPVLLWADTCTSLPSCTDLGFSVPKANLTSVCSNKTYLKCPFGDFYFCSSVDDGCPDYVTVNSSLEVCTKLCPNNSSKCLEKRPITCSEAVRNANGVLIKPSSPGSICGTKTQTLYLTGPIKTNCGSTSPEFIGVRVLPASQLPPCQAEMEGEASLELTRSATIKNSASFYVPTKINVLYFDNYQGSVSFHSDAEVRSIQGYAQTSYMRSINITAASPDYNNSPNVKLGLSCSCFAAPGYSKPKCNFHIMSLYSNVSYYYGGECQSEIECTIPTGTGTCEYEYW